MGATRTWTFYGDDKWGNPLHPARVRLEVELNDAGRYDVSVYDEGEDTAFDWILDMDEPDLDAVVQYVEDAFDIEVDDG